MNIQSAIKEHISNHDFVMLPGIGAFIAEYTKPYLNEKGEIVASERNLRFNSELRNDSDVEILQEFQKRMGISSEQVQQYYFSFLDEFDYSIAQKGQYYWESFGILFKNDKGTLDFREIKETIVPDANQGEQIESESEVLDSISLKIGDKIPKIAENEWNSNLENDYYFVPPREKNDKLLKIGIFTLPFLLLAIALFYTVFYKPVVGKKETHLLEESVVLPDEPEIVESPVIVTQDSIEEPTKTVESSIGNSKKEVKKEDSPADYLSTEEHIVSVGIYRTEKHSDEVATFLAENGYPARVRKYGKLFKVYLVAKNSEQALQYVDEVGKIKGLGVKPLYQR